MSDIGDIDDGEGGGVIEGGPSGAVVETGLLAAGACLACGGDARGAYCSSCGQKNDDLRRSSYVLAKDFFKDTFGFDSRMWRTLGLLALKPGLVPKEFSHGRRSRFTPPVRLFLVVSFLFFLVIGLTNTLFVGLEIEFKDIDPKKIEEAAAAAEEAGEEFDEQLALNCSFQGDFRFFVKEEDLTTDKKRLAECFGDVRSRVREGVDAAQEEGEGSEPDAADALEDAEEAVERIFTGVSWAIANPRAFNDAFNDWLPRVLFFMTPVLALILTLFLRRGVLLFDHLVLSFYSHAVSFAVIAASLVLAQLGAPLMGVAAFLVITVYYIAALKRAYGRGWIKTFWTAFVSGALYLAIFFTVLLSITSNIVWSAAA